VTRKLAPEFARTAPIGRVEIFDVTITEQEWKVLGLCSQTDPEVFFPERGGSPRAAKQVCGQCDVRTKCLQTALDNQERFGVWGGLSERERRKLLRAAS
jgi:WhiB family redox-sensing transcriptional regulator